MKKLIIDAFTFGLFLILIDCQSDAPVENTVQEDTKPQLTYVGVHRGGCPLDTVYKSLIKKEFVDSIYFLNYEEIHKNDTFLTKYMFKLNIPVLDTLPEFEEFRPKLLGKKVIRYNNHTYTVYKFFDDIAGIDAEMLYFFVPEFGVIIEKLAWWGNYWILIDNENRDDIYFLTSMIMYDSDFFHKWVFLDEEEIAGLENIIKIIDGSHK